MSRRVGWSAGGVLVMGVVAALMVLPFLFVVRVPGESHEGEPGALTSEDKDRRERLVEHVQTLGRDIGERNLWTYDSYLEAERYIMSTFEDADYDVDLQPYEIEGQVVRNIEVEIPGTDRADEIVVIGAHYDSVRGSPGANDNGTGVAALLELARSLRGFEPARTVRFVAFANEEPPFFRTQDMGSYRYARRSRERGEDIVGMIALETIGYYSDEPGSQRYPFPLGWFYPDTGNFIGFVSNLGSRGFMHDVIERFREHARLPSEGGSPPGFIPGVGWSDHWSFWQFDYPALMITDTAPFRYPAYHTPQDVPSHVDPDRMTLVVSGLVPVVKGLANPGSS